MTVRGVPLAVALTALTFAAGTRLVDGFGSQYSVSAILTLAAFLGIAAGQTLVIVLGGLDLSIPFVIGLGNVGVAELTRRGWPFGASVVCVLALAAAIGACNGYLSARLRVHSLVVTLGMGTLVQGLYRQWVDGRPSGGARAWLGEAVAPGSSTGPIPVAPVVIFWLVLAVVVVLALRRTVFGRLLYATGANPVAARLSLVDTTAVWTAAFAASAAFAALAGVLLLGFTGGGNVAVSEPYLYLTIGAVVVGGTSMLGGRGGYGATVVGAVLLTVLATLLVGVGASQAAQQVLLGVAIAVVVAVYGRERHVRTRI